MTVSPVTCGDREAELALLASEDLDEPAATRLRRHLDACAGCRARLEEFRGGIDWLRSRRHAPGAARLGMELQARIGRGIAQRAPVPWPFTLVRQLLDALARLRWHHESVVGGLAALLLVVGAIGALQRPLGPGAGQHAVQHEVLTTAPAAVAWDHHDDRLLEAEADEANAAEGADQDVDMTDPGQTDEGAEPPGELAALAPGNGLRIELQTRDPDVRIIWFAGASTP
jgi:anti-sigma factor RsiW